MGLAHQVSEAVQVCQPRDHNLRRVPVDARHVGGQLGQGVVPVEPHVQLGFPQETDRGADQGPGAAGGVQHPRRGTVLQAKLPGQDGPGQPWGQARRVRGVFTVQKSVKGVHGARVWSPGVPLPQDVHHAAAQRRRLPEHQGMEEPRKEVLLREVVDVPLSEPGAVHDCGQLLGAGRRGVGGEDAGAEDPGDGGYVGMADEQIRVSAGAAVAAGQAASPLPVAGRYARLRFHPPVQVHEVAGGPPEGLAGWVQNLYGTALKAVLLRVPRDALWTEGPHGGPPRTRRSWACAGRR